MVFNKIKISMLVYAFSCACKKMSLWFLSNLFLILPYRKWVIMLDACRALYQPFSSLHSCSSICFAIIFSHISTSLFFTRFSNAVFLAYFSSLNLWIIVVKLISLRSLCCTRQTFSALGKRKNLFGWFWQKGNRILGFVFVMYCEGKKQCTKSVLSWNLGQMNGTI